jgi:hypothetical protein
MVKAAPSQEVGLRPTPPPPVSNPTKGGGVELHALATPRWWKSTPTKVGEVPPPYAGGHAAAGEGRGAYIHVKHLVVPLYFLEFPEDPEDSPLRPFFSSCTVELLHVDLIHLFEGP